MLDIFFPPSKTNHLGPKYIGIAFYIPLLLLLTFMIGFIIDSKKSANYYNFYSSLLLFPFIYISFIIWLHLILDYLCSMINHYGKDSLLQLSNPNNCKYNPVAFDAQPVNNNITEPLNNNQHNIL